MAAVLPETEVCFYKCHPDAVIPTKAHPGDAGFDLTSVEDVELKPGQRATVSTGLLIALQNGWEAQVRPRSGNAAKHGVTVLNSPGTIDAGYRGEVCCLLINHSVVTKTFRAGDRIAQLVISRVPVVQVNEIKSMEEFNKLTTSRGANGFGSTGQ